MERVKFGCRDDFCEFFHIHGLDVDDIYQTSSRTENDNQQSKQNPATDSTRQTLTETLVADVQIPKVDSQIIRRDISLLV